MDPNGKKRMAKTAKAKGPKEQRFEGYYIYLRKRRDELRSSNPEMPFPQIISQLAGEWRAMDLHVKQKYLDAAEADKQRYKKENIDANHQKINENNTKNQKKKTEANSDPQSSSIDFNFSGANSMPLASNFFGFNSHSASMISNIDDDETDTDTTTIDCPIQSNHDYGMAIPIFTEEFVHHNSQREQELQALRKTLTKCEEQNVAMQKNVELMVKENKLMENKMREKKMENEMLNQKFDRMKSVLVSGFSSLPLPGTDEPPNIQNIEQYLTNVAVLKEANSVEYETFLKKVEEIIGTLEFEF